MKKIIDQNGRLFGKISIIDVLVILVVIAMAYALHVKNTDLEATSSNAGDVSMEITMLVENQPLYMVDAIQPGDHIYDKERSSGGAIGVITDVKVLPGNRLEKLNNGTFARLDNEDSRNLVLTIQSEGIVSEGRYMINRVYELGANAARAFYTNYAAFTGKVSAISAGAMEAAAP